MSDINQSDQIPAFVREERYIVIKRKHLSEAQEHDLREGMCLRSIGTVECVVVERDWPEFEPVWQMIEARMTGADAHRLASSADPRTGDQAVQEIKP